MKWGRFAPGPQGHGRWDCFFCKLIKPSQVRFARLLGLSLKKGANSTKKHFWDCWEVWQTEERGLHRHRNYCFFWKNNACLALLF